MSHETKVALMVVAIVGMLFASLAYVRYQAGRAEAELAVERQRSAALADSVRHLTSTAGDTVVATRLVLPDEDALRAAITADVRRLLDERDAEARDLVRFTQEIPAAEADGTVVARPEPAADTTGGRSAGPATLHFDVTEALDGFTVEADLDVDVPERRLDYAFRVTPDPQAFTVYTVAREDGLREVWVEGPGVTTRLDAYTLPSTIAARPPHRTRFAFGLDYAAGPAGHTTVAGLALSRTGRWLDYDVLGGLGLARAPAGTSFGPTARLSLRLHP